MKKISTLAVALMTLGSLVTPVQADVISTDVLPSGYYKIKSLSTDRTRNYLFNDFSVAGNANNISLVSATDANANNYIWKITNDGTSTSFGIVNGQGSPVKFENGDHGSMGKTACSTLTPIKTTSLESRALKNLLNSFMSKNNAHM